jgi:hypothetical protein
MNTFQPNEIVVATMTVIANDRRIDSKSHQSIADWVLNEVRELTGKSMHSACFESSNRHELAVAVEVRGKFNRSLPNREQDVI